MKLKKQLLLFIMSAICIGVYADNYSVSKKEQQQILIEADNWIDDMPDGIDDRLSDAVNHALHGFYSEIERFRNLADTTGIDKYKVKVENFTGGKLGELSMRLYSPLSDSSTPILIYFHGGGWSLGSLETSDKFCRALASAGNVKIVSVDYPLAPENPYPNGLKVCIEAVDYILSKSDDWKFNPDLVSLGGDGAGGNLALETYANIKEDKKIKSLVLYYPLINTSGTLDVASKREYGRGYGFDSRLWEIFVQAYKGKSILDSITSLPPTLMITAGRDIIIEEERLFSKAYPNLTYVLLEGAVHGFITDGHQPTAFNKAVEITNAFLSQ
ncbi:MAG: alpha/beta hydrolase [Muribaculaceae bacterium]|nr:alpha/beta hydrolase [Muribaculaceae bacterium]